MRLLIIMPLSSPWARNFVSQIIKLGNAVFVIDLTPKNQITYLQQNDKFQKEDIESFVQITAGLEKCKLKRISPRWIINGALLIRKTADVFRPDILVTLYGGLWGFVSHISRIKPLAMYVVGSDILLGNKFKRFITKQVLNGSSQIFSNGIHLLNKAKLIAPRANITNLYLGINVDKFSSMEMKPINPIVILCSRGFKKIYNNKYLIDGLRELDPGIIDNIKVIFSSAGPQLDEIKEYSKSMMDESLQEKIEFLGGITEERLIQILQRSHIYISLSLSDGASISLMEALSCELFPILSDIPANREWIDNHNGILVPLDDPKTLAQEITMAILNEEWRSATKQYNRELVISRANCIKNTVLFLSKLEELIKA
jgi:glycosyltransferase involved in cell wall biosynthesis